MPTAIGPVGALLLAAIIAPAFLSPATAQVVLPDIVVESASPITGDGSGSTASPLPGSTSVADDTFVPVTVVGDREVLSTQGVTIADSLDQKPGITGSTFAPGSSRPIIRGLDNYRVRVQENGIGSHDVSALSEDHAVPIDPFAVNQIEVIRGPATLRYGSQAIGGVVAVETNRIPKTMPKNGFIGELKGGLSSVDSGQSGAFSVTAGSGGLVLHADGSRFQADDYDTPLGTVENSFVENKSGAVGASYVWSRGYFGVSFQRFLSKYGVPGLEEEEEHGDDDHEEEEHGHQPVIDLKQDKFVARGEWRPGTAGLKALRFWFGATDYSHDEVIEEDGAELVGTRFTNEELEGRFEIEHLPFQTGFGELRGAIGFQAGKKDTKGFPVAEPVDGLLDPAETRTIAGFWFEELQATQSLRLQAALRVEQTRIEGNGVIFDAADPGNSATFAGTQSFTPVSVSLGSLYRLPGNVVASLTGQYVERAPDAAELFSKGIHEATGTFEIGNPFLSKETAATVELGFKRSKGAFRFDVSGYYTRFDGFIFRELDGTGCGEDLGSCGDEDELDLALFKQRDATFYGVELTAQLDVAPMWGGVWGVDGQYDFVRARFSNDENVPRIPPHRLGGGIYYRSADWFMRTGVLHAFEQDDIGVGEVSTPSYTLVSAELSYTATLARDYGGLSPKLTIGLKGENLADEVVFNHASFKRREGIAQPGANVRVFGSLKW